MDFSGTFDTTNALSCMFLWLIFGYLSVMVNCDIQRFIKNSQILFHIFGMLAFFFLFTLLDTNNKSSIGIIWLKTVFVYMIFVLMTKSKWYFVLPVLALLLIDQMIKKEIMFRKQSEKNTTTLENMQKNITSWINYAIIAIIVVGTIHYFYIQMAQHSKRFSSYKFFFTNKRCS